MGFYILEMVVGMKVYLDLIFFINFMFDLLLLMTVSIECKVISKKRNLFLSSFLGSLSTFLLFLPLNNFSLFLFKFVISIIMLLLAFKVSSFNLFKTLFKSLYGNSIILGGLIYFLNNQFSYKQEGFIFIHDGTSLNLIIILVCSPIIFFLYHRWMKKEKEKYNLLHKVIIKYQDKTITTLGYLDTGNTIKDPYKKRSIIIVDNKEINLKLEESLLVPFKTIEKGGLLRCVEIDELIIDGVLINNNYLLGIIPNKIEIEGAKCILPKEMEDELL